MTLNEVTVKDGGVYKCKVKNSEGVDEVEVNLSVVGAPGEGLEF